ncbi:WD-40 repeat-containing protein [Rhodotorula toruloides]|uniref:ASTRA-associated protein 1 n=1 Tax=Rhodotorula toruloides TaxID=5286 RepID=A0A511KPL6_RHOTO|nr:WD-40 repeat-containing protein [Rhodotorula toruloides]
MPVSSLAKRSSSSTPRSPPGPSYILRGHDTSVSCVRFSRCARLIFTGDTNGFVAVWDLRSFRPRFFWKAHDRGVLGVEEHGNGVLTQGRDNLVHFYRLSITPHSTGTSATLDHGAATAVPSPSSPSFGIKPAWSIDINAMNFCRMSVLCLSDRKGKGKEREMEDVPIMEEALMAVPSLTKDDFVDIFHIPSRARLHRSLGKDAFPLGVKTGTVMALHLFHLPSSPSPQNPSATTSSAANPSTSASASSFSPTQPRMQPPIAYSTSRLHLLIGYESGHLALFRFSPTASFERLRSQTDQPVDVYAPREGKMVEENEGWELVWSEKGHRDAVMSLAVTRDLRFAFTVAADHFVCKYRIFDVNEEEALLLRIHIEPTDAPGKSAVAVRSDGKLLATAGWDGELRLYSVKSLQPLAVLSHHRSSLQALDFAPLEPDENCSLADGYENSDDEEEGGRAQGGRAKAWVATGGQEAKVSLWEYVALGWKVVDHDAFKPNDKLGAWWPTIIDSAVLARSRSFVGTDRSTYSHLAGLRVKYWQGGLVEVTAEVWRRRTEG